LLAWDENSEKTSGESEKNPVLIRIDPSQKNINMSDNARNLNDKYIKLYLDI